MKDFWIVCEYYQYYPKKGIDNITLVTFDKEEAYKYLSAWELKQGCKSDYCEIYHSSCLPWSGK